VATRGTLQKISIPLRVTVRKSSKKFIALWCVSINHMQVSNNFQTNPFLAKVNLQATSKQTKVYPAKGCEVHGFIVVSLWLFHINNWLLIKILYPGPAILCE
jgi:hypothetical protein